ncbi:NADH-quinone oxidoreductase subunit J [Paenibacillus sp. J5C_2022]|uniref:NADH-quinone oxidoreductase subunit J n=1 Tax=Paenibacillus sp. J5C2022 TaxID=2977129 RepID=UPI0021CE85A1|nr:NADH-quinone oxidoreductase subunit J [Paenibacillus sp. J5C2022]MCU6708491.1 NADH-quinone oxidoreductase subunit J [Paenibacillus sp. J5C2022]
MLNFTMSGELVAFFIFAALMIGGAVLMITLEKVVHMVVSIAVVFIGLGAMYVLLEAEFVAFVQVLIYGGAVSILMIFGMMMTKHGSEGSGRSRPLYETLIAVGALSLFGLFFYAIRITTFPQTARFHPGDDNTMALGELLFTEYIVPFELVSILLTVAFIGAIVLARKGE